MKTLIKTRNRLVTTAALLLALPTAIFLLFAFMKYELNAEGPFDTIEPTLVSWGLQEGLGWNINLSLVFGPVLALALIALQILKLRINLRGDEFDFHFRIMRRSFPIVVGILSAILIGILVVYFLLENYNHSLS